MLGQNHLTAAENKFMSKIKFKEIKIKSKQKGVEEQSQSNYK